MRPLHRFSAKRGLNRFRKQGESGQMSPVADVAAAAEDWGPVLDENLLKIAQTRLCRSS